MAGDSESVPIHFRPKARLMHLLGENLLRDEITALLELVKNAHDADAKYCKIKLEFLSTKAARIIVEDDGVGMDLAIVTTAWVEPGTSIKQRNPVTASGRRVQGEKGIGRFATDKLAKKLDMYTKTTAAQQVIHFEVDWDKFDDPDRYLDDVGASYKYENIKFRDHGTTLVLSALREKWTRDNIEQVKYGLVRLIPPSRSSLDFKVILEVPEYPTLGGIITNEIVQRAPFRITANLEKGNVKATITRNLPGTKSTSEKEVEVFDFETEEAVPQRQLAALGPIKIDIGAFAKTRRRGKQELSLFPMISISKEDEAVLEQWHGVSIYSDGFWVYPYGETWYDWLQLAQRRIPNLGARFDNKMLVGFVDISRDKNPGLVQQINREGLVHNQSFETLKWVVLSVLSALESDAIASGARRPKQPSPAGETVASPRMADVKETFKALETQLNEAESSLKAGDSSSALSQIQEGITKIESVQQDVSRDYAIYDRFAILGQFVAYVIHGINDNVDAPSLRVDTVRTLLGRTEMPSEPKQRILRLLDKIDSDLEGMAGLVQKWSPFIRKSKPPEPVDLCAYVREVVEDMKKLFPNIGIDVSCQQSSRLELTKGDLWAIIHNLVENSYYWTRKSENPRVLITVTRTGARAVVRISDNGPGVKPQDRPNVFILGWSSKPSGSGLGLKLASESAWNMDGELVLLAQGELEHGASFELRVPTGEGK